MKIDWEEWRDYFELRSAESLEEILKSWRTPPVCIITPGFVLLKLMELIFAPL